MRSRISDGDGGCCGICQQKERNVFCLLPEPCLGLLTSLMHSKSAAEGTCLFRENDNPQGVYFFCAGKARLLTTGSQGQTLVVRIVVPGQVLGLPPAVTGKPHTLTLEALETSKFNFVYRTDFLDFLRHSPEACLSALEFLGHECQFGYSWIRSYGAPLSIAGKLARLLLDGCKDTRIGNQAIRVDLALTHEDIGQLIGASRESVTRAMSEFRKRGILGVDGSTILIHSRPALEKAAALPPQATEHTFNGSSSRL